MASPASHLRAPLLWLLFPCMAGLTAAKLWPAPPGFLIVLAALAAALSLLGLTFAGRSGQLSHLIWACSLCTATSVGSFVMLHFREPQLHQWAKQAPREVTLTLRVDRIYPGAPKARSFSGIGQVLPGDGSDPALVGQQLYFSALRKISIPPQRSGTYVIRGVLESIPQQTGEDGFNDYLANLGIRQKLTRARVTSETAPPNAFRRFCNRTENRLKEILGHGLHDHPEVRSLYLAMLLGEKAVLSADQQNAFMRSGTFHIFSISGLHVGVIAIALHGAFSLLQLPRRLTAILTLSMLWFYCEVTGMNAPALRALLMIVFLFASRLFHLPGNALAALAAAALFTLLLDPLQLFSTGFQMSYSVVTALVIMGGPLTEKILSHWHPFSWLPRPNWRWDHHRINSIGRGILSSCAAGWVAFLASIPSGIGYFDLFSPGSLLANLIIIPLSSGAIISGFLSLMTGLVGLLSLSALFNASAAVIILLMDGLAQHGTRLPGIYFEARFLHAWMAPASVVLTTAVMLACLAGGWARRWGGYWPPVVVLALILIFGVRFS